MDGQRLRKQLTCFEWPFPGDLVDQYVSLVRAWSALCAEKAVCDEVFNAAGEFHWRAFWAVSHTDSRFRPCGAEAVFELWHFFGMFGVSEAAAESVGSHLKKYGDRSKGLSSARVVELTRLRRAGLTGAGTEDVFIDRVWSDITLGEPQLSF